MKRIENIQIKVTAEEKRQFKKLAQKERLNVSDFIRHKCLVRKEEN